MVRGRDERNEPNDIAGKPHAQMFCAPFRDNSRPDPRTSLHSTGVVINDFCTAHMRTITTIL